MKKCTDKRCGHARSQHIFAGGCLSGWTPAVDADPAKRCACDCYTQREDCGACSRDKHFGCKCGKVELAVCR